MHEVDTLLNISLQTCVASREELLLVFGHVWEKVAD